MNRFPFLDLNTKGLPPLDSCCAQNLRALPARFASGGGRIANYLALVAFLVPCRFCMPAYFALLEIQTLLLETRGVAPGNLLGSRPLQNRSSPRRPVREGREIGARAGHGLPSGVCCPSM